MKRILNLTVIMAVVILGVFKATATTITWTNTAGGNWSNPNNWSPHQVPTNTDTALITTPGTYVVNFDFTNYVTDVNNEYSIMNLTLGAGVNSGGTQTLLASFPPRDIYGDMGEFVARNTVLVTNGGVFQITNGDIYAQSLIIDKGGALNGVGEYESGNWLVENGGSVNSMFSYLAGPITITNNGIISVSSQSGHVNTTIGPITIARDGVLNISNDYPSASPFNAPGGTVNVVSGGLTAYEVLDNAGIINLTNSTLRLFGYDDGAEAGVGALNNLSGGVINLQGVSGISGTGENGTNGWVTNSGTIFANGTNSISLTAYIPFDPPNPVLTTPPILDNSHGTITNYSGVLTIGAFNTNISAGLFYSGPSAVTEFSGGKVVTSSGYGIDGYIVTLCEFDLSTILAGPGRFEFAVGCLYLPSSVPRNFVMTSSPNGPTVLELGSEFQGGSITNLTLAGDGSDGNVYGDVLVLLATNSLAVTGTLNLTNADVLTNVTLNAGGVINAVNTAYLNSVTIAAGGQINADGAEIGSGSIARGGTLNFDGDTSIIYYSLTNSGTLILSNSEVDLYYDGLINQASGVIDLTGADQIVASLPADFFINQGVIINNASVGITNAIYGTWDAPISPPYSGLFNFDTSQGVITNLSGTLLLPGFQTNLTGVFYTAAGATTQFGGSGNNFLQAGSSLQLLGPGQSQFVLGLLYLANNTIPNLALDGGVLELGPLFQGGAITNLTLNGMLWTNTSSGTVVVSGPLTVLDEGGYYYITNIYGNNEFSYPGGLYGNYLVTGNGNLTLNDSAAYGTISITNGGTMNLVNGLLNGPVTVAAGGTFYSTNGSILAPVTITSGGAMDPAGFIYFYQPLTNSGTINLTNSLIFDNLNSAYDWEGEVVNQAGGVINIFDSTLPGAHGSAVDGDGTLINAGRINFLTGAGEAGLFGGTCVNSGTITAKEGALVLDGDWTFTSTSSLQVGINSATNYGSFIYVTDPAPLLGNIAINGSFGATLASGYVPTSGTVFNVLSYGSETGTFSSLNLPSGVTWQSSYGPTNFTLVAGSGQPVFATFHLSGTNLIFNGTGGTAGSNYVILDSTNLALPLANWTALTTNRFDGSGQLHFTNPVSPVKPRQFFIFKVP